LVKDARLKAEDEKKEGWQGQEHSDQVGQSQTHQQGYPQKVVILSTPLPTIGQKDHEEGLEDAGSVLFASDAIVPEEVGGSVEEGAQAGDDPVSLGYLQEEEIEYEKGP